MRLSAKDALKSKFFDSIRNSEDEEPSTKSIHLKINDPESFDYDDMENSKYTVKDYKKILKREIKTIKKMNILQ